MTDKEIWERVEAIAKLSNCEKRNVGCIITDGHGNIVSNGFNEHENGICDCIPGPGTAKHAEIMALESLSEKDKEKDLYAYINHTPCNTCKSALNEFCKDIYINPTSKRLKPNMDILEERGKTHGDFAMSSRYVRAAKVLMEATPNWDFLTADQAEALHMLQHKIGRALYGNPHELEHWLDASKYLELVYRRMENELTNEE